MIQVLLVIAGGGVGSAARYLVSQAITERFGAGFPWGTLAVNVTGSLLIGLLAALADDARVIGASSRLLLVTGVLGGFTTFSAFSLETVRLAESGAAIRALLNVGVSIGLCCIAAAIGLAAGRMWQK